MSAPAVTVNLELNQIESGEFVVGTSLVGGSDVIGDGLSEVQSYATRVSIRRGRWGQLYENFDAASISVVLNNESRLFDPVYASGTYYGELVPGRDITITAGGVTIVTGFVQDWDLDYDVSGRSVAIVKATDAIGRLAALQFDAWTNVATTATSKLDAICDRSEVAWSASARDFIGPSGATWANPTASPASDVLLQADSVSWNSNVGAYMALVARSGWLSWFFASADGKLTLRPVVQWATLIDVNSSPTYDIGAAVATFGTGGIPFQTIAAQYGSETLYSAASVDTEGGTAQTSTVPDVDAWQNSYGPSQRLSVPGLLLDGVPDPAGGPDSPTQDGVASLLADDLLAYYDAPVYRITEFSVQLASLSGANQTTVLGIDIADPVTVTFTPNDIGSAITQTLAVQGVAHDITPDSHVVTFSVIDYGA